MTEANDNTALHAAQTQFKTFLADKTDLAALINWTAEYFGGDDKAPKYVIGIEIKDHANEAAVTTALAGCPVEYSIFPDPAKLFAAK